MKITICGSIAFVDEMINAQEELEKLGHEVKRPPAEVMDRDGKLISAKLYYELRRAVPRTESWIWDRKSEAMQTHFEKVSWCDAILVANYRKNGIDGFIGANTLLEMGLAFYLKKRIYLLYPIPNISYTEEILAMKPIVLNENLQAIVHA